MSVMGAASERQGMTTDVAAVGTAGARQRVPARDPPNDLVTPIHRTRRHSDSWWHLSSYSAAPFPLPRRIDTPVYDKKIYTSRIITILGCRKVLARYVCTHVPDDDDKL